MRIKLSDDAISDLARGADFYESIREGLGVYFNDCLASDIDSLLLYAGIHASEDGWFYTMSQRFPYVIWYGTGGQFSRMDAQLPVPADPGRYTVHIAVIARFRNDPERIAAVTACSAAR